MPLIQGLGRSKVDGAGDWSYRGNTDSLNDTGSIDAIFDGRQIRGSWTNPKKTKRLRLVANRE